MHKARKIQYDSWQGVRMHPQPEMRDSLKHISSLLAKIHKGLMDEQMGNRELAAGGLFTPATKLQLLLNDPEFEWLRSLSQLMTLVDDGIFQKDPLTEEQFAGLLVEVKNLLIKYDNKKFADHFLAICRKRPEIMVEHRELSKFLSDKMEGP
jgi:hypothetical protein